MLLIRVLACSSMGLTGCGILVSPMAITDPSCRYGGESFRGSSSTYCSPIAETLRISASRSAGILGDVSRVSVAVAWLRDTSISVTLPIWTPRYVTFENRYRPPEDGSSSLTVILPTPSNVGTCMYANTITRTPTIDAIVKMTSWIRTKRDSISHHPRVPTAQGRCSVSDRTVVRCRLRAGTSCSRRRIRDRPVRESAMPGPGRAGCRAACPA